MVIVSYGTYFLLKYFDYKESGNKLGNTCIPWASQVVLVVKNHLLTQEDPWRWAWQPTPVFLPGEPHGQRGLAGYSPWGHKELDMSEWLSHMVSKFLEPHFFRSWIVWTKIVIPTSQGCCPELKKRAHIKHLGQTLVHSCCAQQMLALSFPLHAAAAKSLQSCPTLCDPIDGSPWGSSVPGVLQARMLEWVAISFSRRSSWLRDQAWVSCIVGRFFTILATREAQELR